jgi:hypothetical protein
MALRLGYVAHSAVSPNDGNAMMVLFLVISAVLTG